MKKHILVVSSVLLAIVIIVAGLYWFVNMNDARSDGSRADYNPASDPNNPFRQEFKDESGNYFYENKELGFSISLPSEFIYFQTQRWDNSDFSDLEILVPTNDPDYTRATPPSYAKPVTIRIFHNEEFWADEDKNEYFIFGEEKGKIYTLKFWERPTKDWQEKWTNEMRSRIEDLVKVL